MKINEETEAKSLVFSDTVIGTSNTGHELHQSAMSVDACLFDDQDCNEDDNIMESGFEKRILSASSSSVFNNEDALRQDQKRSSNVVDRFQKKKGRMKRPIFL